jgi:8-oxo-dGTP pyrophosphatase MutT (NUDIX family)
MIKKVQVWINHGNEVLLLRVIPARGGGWHPVTANVEKGEDLLDCAKRETREETGIEAEAGSWLPLGFSFEYDGRWGRAREEAFVLNLKSRPDFIQIDSHEHVDHQWMSFDQAKKNLGYEPQKEALEKVKCMLSKI